MLKTLQTFPAQFTEGFVLGEEVKLWRVPKGGAAEIIIAGMGGSVLPGRVLPPVLEALNARNHSLIWNTYLLPTTKFQNPIVFCISYSGNTEEALSSFKEAVRKKYALIAITSGGRLASLAKKKRVPLVLIPGGLAPRLAFGYMFGGLLGVLSTLQIIPNILSRLERAAKNQDLVASRRQAKEFAKFFRPGIPLIYTSQKWGGLGHIWKIALNETAKMPAFHYNLPELNHNEMQGMAQNPVKFSKLFRALFIEDPGDHPRIRKRFRLTAKLLSRAAGIKTKTIKLEGPDVFTKVISSSLLAYWSSFETAGQRGIDPENDRIIESFKKEMGKA